MSVLIEVGRTWFKQTFGWSNSRRAWIDRFSTAGLTVGFLLLAWFSRSLTTTRIVVIAAALLLAAGFLLRRGWMHLFGPILFYDLVRAARRTRYFVVRYLVLLTLFGLLFVVHWTVFLGNDSSKWTTGEAQTFTMTYFVIFVVIQSAFLIVLAPAFVAGSVAEEKERKTLEFILATDLHNREIVFGKLLSRLAYLALLFLSGLPILSILQFLGGIDPTLIVAWSAILAIGLVSLSCLSILNSVLNRRPRDAIAISYFCVFGYLFLSSTAWFLTKPGLAPARVDPLLLEECLYVGSAGNPFVLSYFVSDDLNSGHAIEAVLSRYLKDFAMFHGVLVLTSVVLSVLLVRRYALGQAGEGTRRRFRIRWPRPGVTENSLVWKEVFVEKSVYVNFLGRLLFCLLLFVAGAALWYGLDSPRVPSHEVIRNWIQIVGMIGACLLLLTLAGRSATSLSQERDKETLDGLLMAPVSTNSILLAKWVGAMLSIRWGLFFLTIIYLLGVWQGAVHWITVPLMILAWIIYSAVVSLLGLWYSAVCRTSSSATVWTYLSTAGLGVGHWLDMICLLPLFFAGQYSPLRNLVLLQAGFTPPFALAVSFFVPANSGMKNNNPDIADQIGYGLAGLGAWLVIAIVLWILISSRFQLTCGRSSLLEQPADPADIAIETASDGGLAPATNG